MKKLALFLSFLFVISCTKDPIIYTLTTSANPADGGTVSPVVKVYNEGETATITATPAAEYIFQSWSGATGSASSTSLVMSSDKSVTANFVKKKYALTTSVEGEGTVSEKVIKAGTATDYNSGTIVELTATPSAEWLFVEWTGDLESTDNPAQITIDKAKTITAVFVKKQYPLTIEIEGEGTVAEKVIKAGAATDYNSGTVVELTANPSDEWEFKEWTGDLESTDNPAQITIDASKTVKAIFKQIIDYPEVLNGNFERIGSFYTIVKNNQITSDGGGTVIMFGVCWSTQENPTIDDNVVDGVKNEKDTTLFSAELKELESNTKYYFSAFVENERGISYGTIVDFTTNESYIDEEDREYGSISLGDYLFIDKNLDTQYYSNGDKILRVNNMEEAKAANQSKTGAWCYYNFDENNKYMGKIYNWYAVNNSIGLGDDYWGVPSDDDLKASFDKYAGFNNPYIPGNSGYAWGGSSIELKKGGRSGFDAEATGFHMYNTVQSKDRLFEFWSNTKYIYQNDTSLDLAIIRGIMFDDYQNKQDMILYDYRFADAFLPIRLSKKIE